MSASEKLAALESTDSLGNKFQTAPQQQALYAALPQIRALVEAAENAESILDKTAGPQAARTPLRTALAALDKALP